MKDKTKNKDIEENKDEKRKNNIMQRNILERLLEKKVFQKIGRDSKFGNKYHNELNKQENIQEIKLEQIVQIIKQSGKMQQFLDSINNIEIEKIPKSKLHGIEHVERVYILGLVIGIVEKLNDKDMELLIETIKYHDMGRIDEDDKDQSHGFISSELIDDIKLDFSEEEIKIIKTSMICHSLEDSKFEKIAQKLDIKDIERCKKIFEILKDADGLDRVRLLDLDTKLLRTNTAKKMVAAAYELHYNYEYLLNNLTKKQADENEIDIPI